MTLDTNIGYVNADNNDALEPKLTTAGNEKTQTPENLTSKDANDVIDFIKEDREQINTNESNISNNANDISSKADQTDLESVDNRLQTVENDYLKSVDKTELQDNINTVDSKADQNALDISNLPPVPTQTSDLTNNGSDGVNPFITANDIPSGGVTQQVFKLVDNFSGTDNYVRLTQTGNVIHFNYQNYLTQTEFDNNPTNDTFQVQLCTIPVGLRPNTPYNFLQPPEFRSVCQTYSDLFLVRILQSDGIVRLSIQGGNLTGSSNLGQGIFNIDFSYTID